MKISVKTKKIYKVIFCWDNSRRVEEGNPLRCLDQHTCVV